MRNTGRISCHYVLTFWILYARLVLVWSSDESYVDFKMCGVLGNRNESRLMEMASMLEQYKREHGAAAILADAHRGSPALCDRKYLNVISGSCQDMGNSLGSALNAMIRAILQERTIVVDDLRCPAILRWAPWVVTTKLIIPLLYKQKCPLDFSNRYDMQMSTSRPFKHRNVTSSVQLWNQAFGQYKRDTFWYSTWLSEVGQKRSNVIFSCPDHLNSRFEFYGFLARHVLQIGSSVLDLVQPQLKQIFPSGDTCVTPPRSLVIALHHWRLDPHDKRFDDKFTRALQRILSLNPHDTCHLMIFTDDQETKQTFQAVAQQERCITHTVPVQSSAKLTQVAELYLAAHTDYLIGSYDSVLSLLMADFITLNTLMKGRERNHLLWVKQVDIDAVPFWVKVENVIKAHTRPKTLVEQTRERLEQKKQELLKVLAASPQRDELQE